MASSYSIVPGRPEKHKSNVLELGARNLPDLSEARYVKYYDASPLGPPTFCFAQEVDSEAFVGMAAVIPTRLRVRGEAVRGGIAADFAVDDRHRGLGPALRLQRSLLSQLEQADLHFVYGVPNRAADPVFRRLGYADLGRLTRFVKPLKSQIAVDRYIRRPRIGRISSALIDPVLERLSRERRYRRPQGLSREMLTSFDERFTSLWEASFRRHAVLGDRSVELLNWKYESAGPGSRGTGYSIFALADGSSVAGYIVFSTKNNIRHIVDMLSLEGSGSLDALISEFILSARSDNVAGITLLFLGAPNALTERLRAFGFFERKELPLYVHVRNGSPFETDLLDRSNWYFLAGDKDI